MLRNYYATRMSQQDALTGDCSAATLSKVVGSICAGMIALAAIVFYFC